MVEFDLKELKYQRVKNGISQEEMAKALGLRNRSSYIKRESGNVNLSIDEFALVLNKFGLKDNEILVFFKEIVPDKQLKRIELSSGEGSS